MSPELRHLRAFTALADALSFSAAARRLYVSQQSLSRTIQQLERELGVKLFERTTRSVALTPAGEAMLASARRATAAADSAFDDARRAHRGEILRPLRVDVSAASLATPALILRRLREAMPELALHQVERGVDRGLEDLHDGRLDVVLGIATHAPATVRVELVHREPVLVGMAAGHRLAGLGEVPVQALADVELVLPADDAAREWNELVAAFCRDAGTTPRRRPGATHGATAAAEALREEGCVVPTARWADPPADLVFRPLVDPATVIPWSVMCMPHAAEAPEVAAFLAAARET